MNHPFPPISLIAAAASLVIACSSSTTPETVAPSGTQPAPAVRNPLERSTPEAEGIRSSDVLSLVEDLERSIDSVHSFMLLRHGRVVAEGFWNPYTSADRHIMYSVSKSFNSTAVGLAVNEGLLSVEDTVASFFPEMMPTDPDPRVLAMTVKDLLTMSTGHAGDEMDTLRQAANDEWTREFFTVPVVNEPGSTFFYDSSAAYMLSAIVQRVTEQTVLDYLQPRLFEPLGIVEPRWGMSPEGVTLGAGGLAIKTEDLAKLGQLYLQGGLWQGEQLIPPTWAADATAKQIVTGADNGNWNWGYGYQFWRNPDPNGYRADGALGQFSFVLPEQEVVLAITSGTSDTNGVMNSVWNFLLPAIDDAASLPEDDAALQQLNDKLASLALPAAEGQPSLTDFQPFSGQRYTMEANDQNIEAFTLAVDTTPPQLTIEDDAGTHTIALGAGEWVRGTTDFNQRVNELFDMPQQGIAARAVSKDSSTLTVQLAFNETPYIWTGDFSFEGDSLSIQSEYNVRWGDTVQPELNGSR